MVSCELHDNKLGCAGNLIHLLIESSKKSQHNLHNLSSCLCIRASLELLV